MAFGVAPASAAPVRNVAAATCVQGGDYSINPGTYRADDDTSGGDYLTWNGVFKGQLHLTGTASTLSIANGKVAGDHFNECGWWYMFEIPGSNDLCLEYDSHNTAVIADTCDASRASQWWWPAAGPGGIGGIYNEDNNCQMFSPLPANNNVNCSLTDPNGQYDWTIYAHS